MKFFFLFLILSSLQHVSCNSEEDNWQDLEDIAEMEMEEQAPRAPKALRGEVSCLATDAPPLHHSSKSPHHAICDDRGCIPDSGPRYNGTSNTTKSGRACKVWNTMTGEYASYAIYDHNYCRGDPSFVYCFTTDPNVLYEKCDIPRCLNLTKGEIYQKFISLNVK